MKRTYRFRYFAVAFVGLFLMMETGACDTGTLPPASPENECDSCPAVVNGQPACVNGHCSFTCNQGFADFDGDPITVCECDLDTDPPVSSYTDIGTVSGDTGFDSVETSGVGEHWYRVYCEETNSGCVYLSLTIRLTPGSGTDYDLYVYGGSYPNLIGSSSEVGESMEEVYSAWDDQCLNGVPLGSDESKYIYIEVRFSSGNNANNYHLEVYGNT